MIESLKIILACVAAAIIYGVVHDQVTARICIEYFTVFHPPVFVTQSPTLLGLGWGIIATWWVGLFLGLLLALSTRAGSRPKLSAAQQIRPIAMMLLVMACCALIAGLMGFVLARHGFLAEPDWITPPLASSSYPAFVAAWCAHSASYASGFFGGLVLCILQYRKRVRVERQSMKPWQPLLLRVLLVAVIICGIFLSVVGIRHLTEMKAQKGREVAYQTALHSFQQVLKPGMSRKEVEAYLRGKNISFRQMCCVEKNSKNSLDDLTKIGEEKTPWFCSENNIYIAFQFADRTEQKETRLRASDLDTLQAVTIFRWLEGCL